MFSGGSLLSAYSASALWPLLAALSCSVPRSPLRMLNARFAQRIAAYSLCALSMMDIAKADIPGSRYPDTASIHAAEVSFRAGLLTTKPGIHQSCDPPVTCRAYRYQQVVFLKRGLRHALQLYGNAKSVGRKMASSPSTSALVPEEAAGSRCWLLKAEPGISLHMRS